MAAAAYYSPYQEATKHGRDRFLIVCFLHCTQLDGNPMSNYHAYLIRLWRDDEQQPWRAELVSPHSGEARHFATPEQAYAYLQQQLKPPIGDLSAAATTTMNKNS